MRSPLPLVAVFYAGGVLLGHWLPLGLCWLIAAGFSTAALCLVSNPLRRCALALLLVLVAWANTVGRTAVLSPHDLRGLIRDRAEYVTIRGVLVEAPVLRQSQRGKRQVERMVVEVEVQQLRRNGHWLPADGHVVASTAGVLDPAFFSGQRVEVTGVIEPPRGPSAPGQFDYRAYLRWRCIYYQFRSERTNDWCLAPEAVSTARPPLADRFCNWGQSVLAKGLPGEDESLRLLWAMVLGWKTALTPEVAEPFMQSGTLHIFAISGLHIALIADILVRLLRVVRVPRAVSGVIVIPLIWFYTAATGWQASAIRSTVMMTIVIGGWALERPSELLNSLAAAGVIILVWDPLQLFQASFQLSFFVVLGLALITPPLHRLQTRLLCPDPLLPPELRPAWKRWSEGPLRVVLTSLATSLAAWLGSMPLIAYYFYMITPGSLLANLVIVPLSSLALMSSLGSLVCAPWIPLFTGLFNNASWFFMLAMVRLSEWFAQLPGAYFYVTQPSVAVFVVYYLVLAAVLSGVFLSPRWRLPIGLALSVVLLAWTAQWQWRRQEARLTILPSPAGNAFFEWPRAGQRLLVDAGDERSGETLVKPFLKCQGVNRLPKLLLSQGDLRHCGGAQLLQGHFGVKQILTGAAPTRSPSYKRLLEQLTAQRKSWKQLEAGDAIDGWAVVYPLSNDPFAQAENHTVVLRREIYGTSVLLVSSLGRAGQRALLDGNPGLRADVLVTGMSNAGEPACDLLIEAIQPRLIVVASAEYPARARVNAAGRERLAKWKVPVIYTSESGSAQLTFRPNHPNSWEVRTMEGAPVLSNP